MSSYSGIGLMSGNSLDGLDLCHAEFMGMSDSDVWSHRIVHTKTYPYDRDWQERFKVAHQLSGLDLIKLDTEFGHWVGDKVKEYVLETEDRVDFVAYMGHTAFHQPEEKLTFSLGDGETMASYLSCPLVTDFATKDVALGGQGRPLMCFGDKFLYQNYNYCLNLGGQAYISHCDQAFDICPCNMLLNYLAHRMDSHIDFDKSGEVARKGHLLPGLVQKLNDLPYYQKALPKALCREWFDAKLVPLIEDENAKPEDLLNTAVSHIVEQVTHCFSKLTRQMPRRRTSSTSGHPPPISRRISTGTPKQTMLVTGGGARNTYLMEKLRANMEESQIEIVDADDETVDFKEALITAFLGMRCLLGLPNVSQETTGSSTDSVSGSIHLPPNHNLPTSFCLFQAHSH